MSIAVTPQITIEGIDILTFKDADKGRARATNAPSTEIPAARFPSFIKAVSSIGVILKCRKIPNTKITIAITKCDSKYGKPFR